MSYNCDLFKVKKLENLSFKVADFARCEETINKDRSSTFCFCEACITGMVVDDHFQCESIDASGEGSGSFIRDVLEPALKNSTGTLVASCVWEGGDSINRLICKDGEFEWENIEI